MKIIVKPRAKGAQPIMQFGVRGDLSEKTHAMVAFEMLTKMIESATEDDEHVDNNGDFVQEFTVKLVV